MHTIIAPVIACSMYYVVIQFIFLLVILSRIMEGRTIQYLFTLIILYFIVTYITILLLSFCLWRLIPFMMFKEIKIKKEVIVLPWYNGLFKTTEVKISKRNVLIKNGYFSDIDNYIKRKEHHFLLKCVKFIYFPILFWKPYIFLNSCIIFIYRDDIFYYPKILFKENIHDYFNFGLDPDPFNKIVPNLAIVGKV